VRWKAGWVRLDEVGWVGEGGLGAPSRWVSGAFFIQLCSSTYVEKAEGRGVGGR
jgi:hypothetical protein